MNTPIPAHHPNAYTYLLGLQELKQRCIHSSCTPGEAIVVLFICQDKLMEAGY